MRTKVALFLLFTTLTLSADPKKPEITGQRAVAANEDSPFEISFNDLIVTDPDNLFYPWGFTMKLYAGDNYTFTGRTVTPAKNFHGELVVKVSVNDGKNESNKFDLKVTVRPVNDPPSITGQTALSVQTNGSLTIQLSHLTVSDPDNPYPNGFSVIVRPGDNYSVSGTTVTPSSGFSGSLLVNVAVSDGSAVSAQYGLRITVAGGNQKPVITGQFALSTAKNQPFTIGLNHLKVSDPDSPYPTGFTLIIYPESNYTFSGSTVTPATNLVGTLIVRVAVNDGTSISNPFNLQVQVKNELVITGQDEVKVNEDEPFSITLAQLKVFDPENKYPQGYSVMIQEGENYTIKDNKITPAPQFSGLMNVSVKVSNGSVTSGEYIFGVTVVNINDAPEITNFPETPVVYSPGTGPVELLGDVSVADPDDERILLAEAGFREGNYLAGIDILSFSATENIKGIFDPSRGILTLVGSALLEEYASVLNSIAYTFNSTEEEPEEKTVYFRLNDGKDASTTYERRIVVSESIPLDIPTVFTPNDDLANDTWKVRVLQNNERTQNAVIRVFDKRGHLVFESQGFQQEWDGKSAGMTLPSDTYYYTIDFNVNSPRGNYSGTVTILR